ncbi:MAG: hypothetical protein ACRES5_06555 [Pseudomonas sp.]|nr:hypothetical protein [Pseudomonas fluorescens]
MFALVPSDDEHPARAANNPETDCTGRRSGGGGFCLMGAEQG